MIALAKIFLQRSSEEIVQHFYTVSREVLPPCRNVAIKESYQRKEYPDRECFRCSSAQSAETKN